MFFCDAPGGNLQEQKDLNNGEEAREAFGYRCVVCTESCSKRPPEVKREDAENVETTLDTTLGGATEREATYWWLTMLT